MKKLMMEPDPTSLLIEADLGPTKKKKLVRGGRQHSLGIPFTMSRDDN
jgi:hypothetical protein